MQDWKFWSFILAIAKEIYNTSIEVVDGNVAQLWIVVRRGYCKIFIGFGWKYKIVVGHWDWGFWHMWIDQGSIFQRSKRSWLNERLFAFESKLRLGEWLSEWFYGVFLRLQLLGAMDEEVRPTSRETYIFILLLIVTWYRTCGIAEGLEEFSQKNRGVLE